MSFSHHQTVRTHPSDHFDCLVNYWCFNCLLPFSGGFGGREILFRGALFKGTSKSISPPSKMMKKWKHTTTLAVLFFAVVSIPLNAAELREWTSSKGTTLKAELVSKTDSHLTLRQASGKEITLAIKQLSDADQNYLKQLDEAASDKGQNKVDKGKKKAGLLPVLHDGIGVGYFAYFEGEHYVARINANASLEVCLKDKEQTSGLLDGWKMEVEPVAYKKNKLGTISGYKMKEILNHGDPVENPNQVKLSVMLKGDIKCELIYEFTPEGLTTWMRSERGSDPPEVMNHMMTHRLGEVSQLTSDPKDLESMRLKVRSDKYDYLNKHRINTTVSNDKYEVSMPAITSTKILFNKGSDRNTRLMCWKYGDDALSKGYFIRSRKGVFNSTKHDAEKTSITFKGK